MLHEPPLPDADFCLFLDIDGTLLEFAPKPDAVRVDAPLRELLRDLAQACEGAVALVSGRRIADIDHLFKPLRLAAAGVHGCERRDVRGHWLRASFEVEALAQFRERVAEAVRPLDGVRMEDKGIALAMHYRTAPHLEGPLRASISRLASMLPVGYEVLEGESVLEIKPHSHDKASAVEAFMQEPPFTGRLPIFIGDDVTDQDGFAAVRRFNGLAIGVGEAAGAQWRLANPTAVRRWLQSLLVRMQVS